jgi:hypothetical protein
MVGEEVNRIDIWPVPTFPGFEIQNYIIRIITAHANLPQLAMLIIWSLWLILTKVSNLILLRPFKILFIYFGLAVD